MIADPIVKTRVTCRGGILLALGIAALALVRVIAHANSASSAAPLAAAGDKAPAETQAGLAVSAQNLSKPISRSDAAEINSLRSGLRIGPILGCNDNSDLIGALASNRFWTEALPLGQQQTAAINQLDEVLRAARSLSLETDADYPARDLASYQAYVDRGHQRRHAAFRQAQRVVSLGLLTEPQAAFVIHRILTTRRPIHTLGDENVQELLGMTAQQKRTAAAIAAGTTATDAAILEILTPRQMEKWSILTAQQTLPAEPPKLPTLSDAAAASSNLDELWLIARLTRKGDKGDLVKLSAPQKKLLKDLEDVTRQGLHWINLQHPDDPTLPADVRKAHAERVLQLRADFVLHAWQFVLLGILTQDQALIVMLSC